MTQPRRSTRPRNTDKTATESCYLPLGDESLSSVRESNAAAQASIFGCVKRRSVPSLRRCNLCRFPLGTNPFAHPRSCASFVGARRARSRTQHRNVPQRRSHEAENAVSQHLPWKRRRRITGKRYSTEECLTLKRSANGMPRKSAPQRTSNRRRWYERSRTCPASTFLGLDLGSF